MNRVIAVLGLVALPALAGSVTVTRGDEHVDVFALRDKLVREQQWQDWLRHQQAIEWLKVLPVNCEVVSQDDGSYRCGGQWYKSYQQQDGEQMYIRGEPSGNSITPGASATPSVNATPAPAAAAPETQKAP